MLESDQQTGAQRLRDCAQFDVSAAHNYGELRAAWSPGDALAPTAGSPGLRGPAIWPRLLKSIQGSELDVPALEQASLGMEMP